MNNRDKYYKDKAGSIPGVISKAEFFMALAKRMGDDAMRAASMDLALGAPWKEDWESLKIGRTDKIKVSMSPRMSGKSWALEAISLSEHLHIVDPKIILHLSNAAKDECLKRHINLLDFNIVNNPFSGSGDVDLRLVGHRLGANPTDNTYAVAIKVDRMMLYERKSKDIYPSPYGLYLPFIEELVDRLDRCLKGRPTIVPPTASTHQLNNRDAYYQSRPSRPSFKELYERHPF